MITERRRIALRLGLSLAALSAFFSLGILPGSAGAQVSALPLNFSDVAIFATNSARIDNGAQVTSGHVVVNSASSGPTLSPGVELGLGNNAHTPTGYAVVADSIAISNGAVVGGNAFFNTLSNSGKINGTQNTPLALPVFTPLPTFKSAPPGTLDVTVPNGTVQTLAAGNYRDIKVLQNATLRIDQGVTNVRTITVSNGGKLLFLNLTSGRSEVRVAEQMTIGNGFVVAPVDLDPLKASKIVFYVASPTTTTVAVDTGNGGTLFANVYAPNGTLVLDNGTNAVGAFLAKNVDVQNGSHVALESFFAQQAPAITSAASTTFTLGQAGTFTVTTTGFPTPSITRSGALPAGVTFVDNGNGTGTLSGTPTASGTFPITFTASNGVLPNAVQNFTLNVYQPPAITSPNAVTFTVGQLDSFTVTTTGFPTPSITQGGAVLPAGVTFVDNGGGTGTLSGTPAAGTSGTYAITFTATSAAGSTTQNFTLTVNQAPAITSPNATTFVVGQLGSFLVTTTGFPAPSIIEGGALPANVGFVNNGNGTGTLSGIPASGTGGTYPLTFTASNGVPPSALQNFTLTVAQPPAAQNDGPYLADANTTFFRSTSDPDDLLDNDTLGAPAATITSFGGGSLGGTVTSNAAGTTANFGTGGSLVVQSNGEFTFTPALGFTGVFTFQYRLTNTGGTSDATVTIHVRPKATPDTLLETVVGNVVVNTPFSVLTNDVFNGTPIVVASAFSTNGGSVTMNLGGTFTYNPPVGYQGTDAFTYTITDSSGFTSAPVTVTVTVSGMIWFVNNNAGACSSLCNGRLTNPFTTLDAFTGVNDGVGTHPGNGQNIFVYESATSYTFSSGTLLRTGQKLIGQDATASLATIAGVTVPTGSTLPTMNTGGNATTIGSTVTLAGSSTVRGLTIATGSSTGLSGGAVSGVAVSEVISATTIGTAVNLNGTGGTVSLISVSANGAANGILVQNTTGSFSVTGTGSAGSGGTIQNTTGRGASFVTAQSISLTNMNFTNTATVDLVPVNSGLSTGGNLGDNAAIHLQSVTNVTLDRIAINGSSEHGINGHTVTNLTLSNSTVQNAGNAPDENGLSVYNLLGTNSITNTSITGSGDDNLNIQNDSATASTITITGGSFNNAVRGSGLLFGPRGTNGHHSTITISGVTVDNNFSGGIVSDASNTAGMTIKVSGSTITNNNDGIQVIGASGNVQFDIHDNTTISGNDFAAVTVLKAAFSNPGTLEGKVRNNPITVPNNRPTDGISIFNAGAGALKIAVTGNTLNYGGSQRAILVQGGQDGNGSIDATITGNAIDVQLDGVANAVNGIMAQTAITGPGNTSSLCADIGGPGVPNTFVHSLGGGLAGGDIRVRQRNDGTVRLPGYAGGATDTAAVAAYLDGRNSVVSLSTATAQSSGFADGGSCSQPSVP
jgi:Big-like domain-containing protein/putative Ig domain-containing protein